MELAAVSSTTKADCGAGAGVGVGAGEGVADGAGVASSLGSALGSSCGDGGGEVSSAFGGADPSNLKSLKACEQKCYQSRVKLNMPYKPQRQPRFPP